MQYNDEDTAVSLSMQSIDRFNELSELMNK